MSAISPAVRAYKHLLVLRNRQSTPVCERVKSPPTWQTDVAAFFLLMHRIAVRMQLGINAYVEMMAMINNHMATRDCAGKTVTNRSTRIRLVLPLKPDIKLAKGNAVQVDTDFDERLFYIVGDFVEGRNPFVLAGKWNNNASCFAVKDLEARIWSLYLLGDGENCGSLPVFTTPPLPAPEDVPEDVPEETDAVREETLDIPVPTEEDAMQQETDPESDAVREETDPVSNLQQQQNTTPGMISMTMRIGSDPVHAWPTMKGGGISITPYADIVSQLVGFGGLRGSLPVAADRTAGADKGDAKNEKLKAGQARNKLLCVIFYAVHIWCRMGVAGDRSVYGQFMHSIYASNVQVGVAIALPWDQDGTFYDHMVVMNMATAAATSRAPTGNPFLVTKRGGGLSMSPNTSVYALGEVRDTLRKYLFGSKACPGIASAFPVATVPDVRTSPNARAPNARAPNARAPNARAPNARAPNARARAPNARAPNARAPNARAPNARARAPNARAPNARAPNARAQNARAPNVTAHDASTLEDATFPAVLIAKVRSFFRGPGEAPSIPTNNIREMIALFVKLMQDRTHTVSVTYQIVGWFVGNTNYRLIINPAACDALMAQAECPRRMPLFLLESTWLKGKYTKHISSAGEWHNAADDVNAMSIFKSEVVPSLSKGKYFKDNTAGISNLRASTYNSIVMEVLHAALDRLPGSLMLVHKVKLKGQRAHSSDPNRFDAFEITLVINDVCNDRAFSIVDHIHHYENVKYGCTRDGCATDLLSTDNQYRDTPAGNTIGARFDALSKADQELLYKTVHTHVDLIKFMESSDRYYVIPPVNALSTIRAAMTAKVDAEFHVGCGVNVFYKLIVTASTGLCSVQPTNGPSCHYDKPIGEASQVDPNKILVDIKFCVSKDMEPRVEPRVEPGVEPRVEPGVKSDDTTRLQNYFVQLREALDRYRGRKKDKELYESITNNASKYLIRDGQTVDRSKLPAILVESKQQLDASACQVARMYLTVILAFTSNLGRSDPTTTLHEHLSEEQRDELDTCLDIYNQYTNNPSEYATDILDTADIDVDCSQVMRFPQFSDTCWFNALLMALFYSQGMRRVLVDKFSKWEELRNDAMEGTKEHSFAELRATFKTILQRHYTGKSFADPQRAYSMLSVITPEVILGHLHSANVNTFGFNVLRKQYGNPGSYIHKLLGLLQVKNTTMLFAVIQENKKTYTLYDDIAFPLKKELINAGFTSVVGKDTEVLIIRISSDPAFKKPVAQDISLLGGTGIIKVNGVDFVLDSFTIMNVRPNDYQGVGHVIAGITCNTKRFMYNGWGSSTMDPARKGTPADPASPDQTAAVYGVPCPLFDFDWLDEQNNKSFCPSSTACALDLNVKSDNLCFRLTEGDRLYLAVNVSKFNLRPAPSPSNE